MTSQAFPVAGNAAIEKYTAPTSLWAMFEGKGQARGVSRAAEAEARETVDEVALTCCSKPRVVDLMLDAITRTRL